MVLALLPLALARFLGLLCPLPQYSEVRIFFFTVGPAIDQIPTSVPVS